MTTPVRGCSLDQMGWLSELHALVDAVNRAVYEAVVGTATPCLDRLLVGVSNAANYSRLWLVTDAAVAAGRGWRAACQGVLAVVPSGHAASAFAFASAMGQAASTLRLHLHVAAATVAYPRVHPGVHHPSDVAIGAVTGNLCRGAVRHLAPRAATLR
jgi:membrane-associated phospholipid phosphatase